MMPIEANSFRTRASLEIMLRPATNTPSTIARMAVLVCDRYRISTAMPVTNSVPQPLNRAASHITTTSPSVTAANSATWGGGVGQNAPPSLPPPSARDGEMMRPRIVKPSTTVVVMTWLRTSSRSLRPHHGDSSQSAKMNPPSRKLR